MSTKRSYNEACGIARALDVVGERWTLMIVRELILGPKRFTDIRASLPGLSADVLSQRLRELEQGGLLEHRVLAPPAASKVYELTPKGLALEDALMALGRWGGANAPPPRPGQGMSLDSHIVSFRTLFDPARAEGFDATIGLRLGAYDFRARVADGAFEIDRGEARSPDAVITSDPTTLIDVAHGRRELADALGSGDLAIEGDAAAVERFLSLFPLPEPALA